MRSMTMPASHGTEWASSASRKPSASASATDASTRSDVTRTCQLRLGVTAMSSRR